MCLRAGLELKHKHSCSNVSLHLISSFVSRCIGSPGGFHFHRNLSLKKCVTLPVCMLLLSSWAATLNLFQSQREKKGRGTNHSSIRRKSNSPWREGECERSTMQIQTLNIFSQVLTSSLLSIKTINVSRVYQLEIIHVNSVPSSTRKKKTSLSGQVNPHLHSQLSISIK